MRSGARIAVLLAALCSCGRLGFDDVTRGADAGNVGDSDGDGPNDSSDGSLEDAPTLQGGWTVVTPASPTTTDLYAVWAFGANDYRVGGGAGEVQRFNGTGWDEHAGPVQDVYGLWGATPNDVWEGGALCEVKRWNGSMWTAVTMQNCGGSTINAVAGTAANDVWLAGVGGQLYHYTGTTTLLPQANNIDMFGIWPVGTNQAYFVGSKGTMLHYNGTTMLDEHIPTNAAIRAVWGANANDVWAVGEAGVIYRKQNGGLWIQQVGPTSGFLRAIWGTSASDIWAVGDAGLAIHYDGMTWKVVTLPTTMTLHAIAGVPGGGARIVGDGGTVLAHP